MTIQIKDVPRLANNNNVEEVTKFIDKHISCTVSNNEQLKYKCKNIDTHLIIKYTTSVDLIFQNSLVLRFSYFLHVMII